MKLTEGKEGSFQFIPIEEIRKIERAVSISRWERYHPKNILRAIRENVPLPIAFSLIGIVTFPLVGSMVFKSAESAVLLAGVGFTVGFILGCIADSHAGPEEEPNIRTGF